VPSGLADTEAAIEASALSSLTVTGLLAITCPLTVGTLGVGLSLTVGQIVTPLRNPRLIVLALLANFVLTPLAALALWRVLGLHEPLGVGLLLCGLAAGAPFLLKLAEFARGDMAFAVGLMVLLMVLTVGYVPLVLPLLLTGTAVNPAKIAQSLVVLMLIPLATGLTVRARKADARLELTATGDAELEMWATGRHIAPLEEVVGRPVRLVLSGSRRQSPPAAKLAAPVKRRKAAART